MVEEEARLQQERGQEGTWYHEGPIELRDARLWIANYSLPKARERYIFDSLHFHYYHINFCF